MWNILRYLNKATSFVIKKDGKEAIYPMTAFKWSTNGNLIPLPTPNKIPESYGNLNPYLVGPVNIQLYQDYGDEEGYPPNGTNEYPIEFEFGSDISLAVIDDEFYIASPIAIKNLNPKIIELTYIGKGELDSTIYSAKRPFNLHFCANSSNWNNKLFYDLEYGTHRYVFESPWTIKEYLSPEHLAKVTIRYSFRKNDYLLFRDKLFKYITPDWLVQVGFSYTPEHRKWEKDGVVIYQDGDGINTYFTTIDPLDNEATQDWMNSTIFTKDEVKELLLSKK